MTPKNTVKVMLAMLVADEKLTAEKAELLLDRAALVEGIDLDEHTIRELAILLATEQGK